MSRDPIDEIGLSLHKGQESGYWYIGVYDVLLTTEEATILRGELDKLIKRAEHKNKNPDMN